MEHELIGYIMTSARKPDESEICKNILSSGWGRLEFRHIRMRYVRILRAASDTSHCGDLDPGVPPCLGDYPAAPGRLATVSRRCAL